MVQHQFDIFGRPTTQLQIYITPQDIFLKLNANSGFFKEQMTTQLHYQQHQSVIPCRSLCWKASVQLWCSRWPVRLLRPASRSSSTQEPSVQNRRLCADHKGYQTYSKRLLKICLAKQSKVYHLGMVERRSTAAQHNMGYNVGNRGPVAGLQRQSHIYFHDLMPALDMCLSLQSTLISERSDDRALRTFSYQCCFPLHHLHYFSDR